MKAIHLVFSLSIFVLLFAGCDDDDDTTPVNGDVQMHFYVKYGSDPVAILKPVDYVDDIDLYFTRFSLYLSEVTLLTANGEQEILDIDFINFTDDLENETVALEGTEYMIPDVPPGDYTGIRFGLGVPVALNAMTPAEFDPDHPLANSGEYWSGWQSYIFHKTEGRADINGDGDFETPIALHVGSDTTYREVTFQTPFTVNAGEVARLPYDINLRDMLIQGNKIYDIEATPQIHSLSQMDAAITIADGLSKAILERFE